MDLAGDLVGVLILGGLFLAVLVAAEAWRRLGNPRPEWTRKLVHIAGGAVCLFFPLLIKSSWVVLGMALALSGLFTLAAGTGLLKSLHGVERSSRGAEYYPLSIWVLFLLAADRYWLYLAAILVLAVADALAALVGSRFGRIRYEVQDDHKSLEGSLVFLGAAFLAMFLPMWLMTELPVMTSLLSALLVAVLVTGFEAISLRGTDNVFVPLAVVVALSRITTKPVEEILAQNVSLACVILGMTLLALRLPVFNVGGTIVLILYAYGNWSLGSLHWALPIFAGIACYFAAWVYLAEREPERPRKVRAVAYALLVPFLVLAVANATDRYDLHFGPFLAASAAIFTGSVSGPLLRLPRRGAVVQVMGVLGVVIVGAVVIAMLPWLLQPRTTVIALLAIPLVLFPTTLLLVIAEDRWAPPPARQWTAHRMLLTVCAAGLIYLGQVLEVIPHWNPA